MARDVRYAGEANDRQWLRLMVAYSVPESYSAYLITGNTLGLSKHGKSCEGQRL